jgi:hypothetical protein
MGRGPWVEAADGGGKGPGGERFGRLLVKEVRATEAAIPLAAFRVEDPELRPSPRRPVPGPGDERLRSLADDIAAEPDPAPAPQLQPEPRGFRHGSRQTGDQSGRLQRDEERLRTSGEGREPPQPIRDFRGRRARVRPWREIDHENVHRARGEEHPGDREPFVERRRRQDDQPIERDAASGRLDRIERPRDVQPCHDRTVFLCLRDEPQGEGRRAGARRAPEGNARAARQATGSDDRIQGGEARPDDPLDAGSRLARRSRERSELRWVVGRLDRKGHRGERTDDPRSCRTPPRLEGRQSRRHVRGEARHRTVSIEHPFGSVNDFVAWRESSPEPARHRVVTARAYGRP